MDADVLKVSQRAALAIASELGKLDKLTEAKKGCFALSTVSPLSSATRHADARRSSFAFALTHNASYSALSCSCTELRSHELLTGGLC